MQPSKPPAAQKKKGKKGRNSAPSSKRHLATQEVIEDPTFVDTPEDDDVEIEVVSGRVKTAPRTGPAAMKSAPIKRKGRKKKIEFAGDEVLDISYSGDFEAPEDQMDIVPASEQQPESSGLADLKKRSQSSFGRSIKAVRTVDLTIDELSDVEVISQRSGSDFESVVLKDEEVEEIETDYDSSIEEFDPEPLVKRETRTAPKRRKPRKSEVVEEVKVLLEFSDAEDEGETDELIKPTQTYCELIAEAIEKTESKKIRLNDLYYYIMKKHKYYRKYKEGWKVIWN
jgi:Forkhead domain